MRYVIATDGALGERAARTLHQVAPADAEIHVLTVVSVPSHYAAALQPRQRDSDRELSLEQNTGMAGLARPSVDVRDRVGSDGTWPGTAEVTEARVEAEAAERQTALMQALKVLGRVPRSVRIAGDRTIPEILEYMEEVGADVLVIGAGSGRRTSHLGSLASRLIKASEWPVLVVPAG